jgi:hypothetical protein
LDECTARHHFGLSDGVHTPKGRGHGGCASIYPGRRAAKSLVKSAEARGIGRRTWAHCQGVHKCHNVCSEHAGGSPNREWAWNGRILFETPASIACIYGLAPRANGCNPNIVRQNAAGGSKIIAIVDAFHAPNVAGDLQVFSRRFGLSSPNLHVAYAAGTPPPLDTTKGWELEATLDVEWALAIAPDARLELVEANSDTYEDLFKAVKVATGIVQQVGGGQVSLSWGGYEFPSELGSDTNFNGTNVVYFAATGDTPGVNYLSTSTNVVAVGGTTIQLLWDIDIGLAPDGFRASARPQQAFARPLPPERVPDPVLLTELG